MILGGGQTAGRGNVNYGNRISLLPFFFFKGIPMISFILVCMFSDVKADIIQAHDSLALDSKNYSVAKILNNKKIVEETYLFMPGKSMSIQKDGSSETRRVANEKQAFEAYLFPGKPWKIAGAYKPSPGVLGGIHYGSELRACLPWHPSDSPINLINMKYWNPVIVGADGKNVVLQISKDDLHATIAVNPDARYRIERYTIDSKRFKCTGEKIYDPNDPLKLVREKQDFGHYKMDQVFEMLPAKVDVSQFSGSYYGVEMADGNSLNLWLIAITVICILILNIRWRSK